MRQQVKRITPTSQQILAAPQHQRTAQRFGLLAGQNFVHRQPAWSDDSGIERAPGIDDQCLSPDDLKAIIRPDWVLAGDALARMLEQRLCAVGC